MSANSVNNNTNNVNSDLAKPVEKKWLDRSVCSIDHISWALGIVFMITGIVLAILNSVLGYNFNTATIVASSLGGAAFSFGLLTHCCRFGCCFNETFKLDKKAVAKPTQNFTPVSLEIATKDFFASKGIFGLENALLTELDLWRRYRSGEEMTIAMDAGMILYGPPGTGKTTIAQAIAELLGGEYYEKKCGDLKSKYYGEPEKNIDALFDIPLDGFRVVTIDEISGILGRRNGHWTDQIVEHFLGKVSGTTNTKPNYIIIGTTNKYDLLDQAVVRRGRLGGQYQIDNPSQETRRAIFQHQLSLIEWSEESGREALVAVLVEGTNEKSCAEVVSIVSDAKKQAFLEKRKVCHRDLLTALQQSKSRK